MDEIPLIDAPKPAKTWFSGWGTSSNSTTRPGVLDVETASSSKVSFETVPIDPKLRAKEEALRRKEADLLARERELKSAAQAVGERYRKNFPPCWPMMYHNIDAEIPLEAKPIVRWLYVSWLALPFLLILNSISCLAILVSHPTGVTTGGTDFGVSITYCFVIFFASFWLWYRPVYNAFLKNSSMYYNIYFTFGGLHLLFSYYMVIGISGSGSAGIINAIAVFSDQKYVAFAFCGVNALFWLLSSITLSVLYKRVHYQYRQGGLSLENAQNEAIQSVASSKVTRSAVTSYMMSSRQ
ncbi:hypothetical protein SmJEL517_g01331 [Synchytrium microbalum]|uniref:Scamp-domain-containing protein n=1 Tax=Synchytrium microbalum TaxID=1806994 RepID=A0A507CG98_9FUNG|nr:uncharacterized protein SmJEL517_g01331 [Synchytrium microbalum]TPX36503.1 hypothetical protein SmJEL517_g01331 [Synchytrium microbalum]